MFSLKVIMSYLSTFIKKNVLKVNLILLTSVSRREAEVGEGDRSLGRVESLLEQTSVHTVQL